MMKCMNCGRSDFRDFDEVEIHQMTCKPMFVIRRYAIFAYDCYYPHGGMNDFYSSHDTLEAAKAAVWDKHDEFGDAPRNRDIVYIHDMSTNKRAWSPE